MQTLLHIDTSSRLHRSHSRVLTQTFRRLWQQRFPGTRILYRDLRAFAPPHVTQDWIEASFTPATEHTPQMQQALQVSDLLVEEWLQADVYLLGIAMYNFSVPSAFKAYIDNIVRVNRTFLFTPQDTNAPYKPLLHGKKMFVVVSSGDSGYQPGGSLSHLNHVEPYLRTVFGFIGITDIRFIYCGNDEFGGAALEQSLNDAQQQIQQVVCSPEPVAV
jgi:FMN-dependent NADH-azoreductase